MSEVGFGGSVSGTQADIKLENSITISDSNDKSKNKKSSNNQLNQRKSKSSRGDESKSSEIVVGVKVMLKHGFGSSLLQMDGIQSYSTLLGEKDVNERILYRVGRQLCVFDPESGRQQFFTGRPRGVVNILHFAISHNSRYVSICESSRNQPEDSGFAQVSVYSLTSFARQKTLIHSPCNEFICSSFCGESKYLATLSDDQERMVILWLWEKERIFKSLSVNFKITKLHAAPTSVQLTSTGGSFLKMWYLGPDGNLKVGSLLPSTKEGENFCDHLWLPTTDARRIVALSEMEGPEGQIHRQTVYIFEGNESTSNAAALAATHGSSVPPIPLEFRQAIQLRLESGTKVIRLIASNKGFILVGSGGHMSFFEKTEDKKEPYVEFRTVTLGKECIYGGTMLPSEEKLVLITESSRLLTFPLGNIEVVGNTSSDDAGKEVAGADLSFGGFHRSPVLSTDVAQQRPILATVSQDHTARIWNFETLRCELVHDFRSDDPAAIAVYYTGFQVLIAFKERVRMYNILMDKLKLFKETVIKGCKELKFSNGGHLWAAASTINVMVFDTKTFQQLVSFQGHMMAVRRMAWGPSDQVLFSAGAEGNVYGWSLLNDQRLDVIASSGRSSGILGLAIDGGNSAVIGALGSAGVTDKKSGTIRMQEFEGEEGGSADRPLGNSAIISTKDGLMKVAEWTLSDARAASREGRSKTCKVSPDGQTYITVLQMSADRQFVYAGTNMGGLRVYSWPLDDDNPYVETLVHVCPVVDLRESPSGNTVLTVGEDGTIFVHVVFKGENVAYATSIDAIDIYGGDANERIYNADVLFVSSEDIEEHVHEVVELQKRIEDTNTKHTFELHRKESMHSDEVKRLLEQHEEALNSEKDKYEALQREYDERVRNLLSSIESKSIDHVKITSELENRYEHKLANQLDRYDRLSEEMELLKQRCDGLIAAERAEYEKQLADLRTETRQREKRMRIENKRIRDDRASDEGAFKEVLDQQEEEYEDELRQLIAAAEAELKSERKNITTLRTLVQTKNTKLDQLKKKLIELTAASKQRQAMLIAERKDKQKLQDTIEHYKKNLLEREEALAEKEKVILDLRNSTRTLENFRFVLDHRLQQLMSERGPITKHIEGLEHHIRSMYEELVKEFEAKKDSNMQTELKDLKIQSYLSEVERLRHQQRQKDLYIASFKRELSNVVAAQGGPKEVELAAKSLYKKYVRGELVGGAKPDNNSDIVVSSDHDYNNTNNNNTNNDLDGDNIDIGNNNGNDNNRGKSNTLNNSNNHNTSQRGGRDMDNDLLEATKEAERQKMFAERQASNLRHRLQGTKTEAIRNNQTRLMENSQLVYECNDLRREVKLLTRQLDASMQREAESQRLLKSFRNKASEKRSISSSQSDGVGSNYGQKPGEGSASLLAPSFLERNDIDWEGLGDSNLHDGSPLGIGVGMSSNNNNTSNSNEDGGSVGGGGGSSSQKKSSHGQGSLKNLLERNDSNNTKSVGEKLESSSQLLSLAAQEIAQDALKQPPLTKPMGGQEWRGGAMLSGNVTRPRDRRSVPEPLPLPEAYSGGMAAQLSLGRLSPKGRKVANIATSGNNVGPLVASQSDTALNNNAGGRKLKLHVDMSNISKMHSKEEFLTRRLTDEVNHLSAQLDDAQREKALQQAEINRLRQQVLEQRVQPNQLSAATPTSLLSSSWKRRSSAGRGSRGGGGGRTGSGRPTSILQLDRANAHKYHLDPDDVDDEDYPYSINDSLQPPPVQDNTLGKLSAKELKDLELAPASGVGKGNRRGTANAGGEGGINGTLSAHLNQLDSVASTGFSLLS